MQNVCRILFILIFVHKREAKSSGSMLRKREHLLRSSGSTLFKREHLFEIDGDLLQRHEFVAAGDGNKRHFYGGHLEEIMDQLTLFIAIFATLAVLLAGLLFLKSQTSSSGSETKTGARRRAAVPNRDEDGQIVNAGPGPRGRRGAGPRMQRRR